MHSSPVAILSPSHYLLEKKHNEHCNSTMDQITLKKCRVKSAGENLTTVTDIDLKLNKISNSAVTISLTQFTPHCVLLEKKNEPCNSAV